MKEFRKAIAILMMLTICTGLCASAYADTSTTVTDNDSSLQEFSAPSLDGTTGGTIRADISPETGRSEIPITSSGMLGVDVQITKGGEFIESVTIKDGNLVVKVRNSGTLKEEQEYAVNVTLYDMETGKSSLFTITGIIGATSSSSSTPDNPPASQPESSSKPGENTSSSPDKKIGLKDAQNGVVTANLYQYGSDDEVEIPIIVPDHMGTIRLKDKNTIEGRDVVRKVSVSNKKLIVEAKFPYDLLEEPEEYEIEVTLEDNKTQETAVFTIKGSVYWQDTDAPVAPDEYREKDYVVVDFDDNDGETIHFKNGRILTDGLKSGIVNLDVTYASSYRVDCDDLDLYFVNFPAHPRLDRSVTLCLDADKENCVYEIGSGGKLTQIDAEFYKSEGELRFETRRLGEYVVTEKELGKSDHKYTSSSSNSKYTSSLSDREERDTVYTDTELPKPIPNTGCY